MDMSLIEFFIFMKNSKEHNYSAKTNRESIVKDNKNLNLKVEETNLFSFLSTK